MTISGKNVLVTGASAGIGAALARQLAAGGARLVLVSRSRPDIPTAHHLAVDLADPLARQNVIADAEAALGPLDLVIHSAGIGLYASSWLADPAHTRAMFELNLLAAVDLARAAVPGMVARRQGMIVNIGSVAGKVTLPWFTLYSATKSALGTFTEGLRMELYGTGVHAMLVCPGYVHTGFQDHVLGGRPPRKIREAKRFAITPEQCAAAIVRGIEKNARTVMTPRAGWALVAAARLLPAPLQNQFARYNREP